MLLRLALFLPLLAAADGIHLEKSSSEATKVIRRACAAIRDCTSKLVDVNVDYHWKISATGEVAAEVQFQPREAKEPQRLALLHAKGTGKGRIDSRYAIGTADGEACVEFRILPPAVGKLDATPPFIACISDVISGKAKPPERVEPTSERACASALTPLEILRKRADDCKATPSCERSEDGKRLDAEVALAERRYKNCMRKSVSRLRR